MQGNVIIVSGPSGVGKGTILREVFSRGEFPLVMSVSATTRAPRPGERDGVDYHFLTQEDFEKRLSEGRFLEHFKVFEGGAQYGTLRDQVQAALEAGNWVVLEIDVQGAKEVLKTYPEAITIFIMPPDGKTLRARLVGRGTETETSLEKRTRASEREMAQRTLYKHVIVNDNLDRAVGEFLDSLRKANSSECQKNIPEDKVQKKGNS